MFGTRSPFKRGDKVYARLSVTSHPVGVPGVVVAIERDGSVGVRLSTFTESSVVAVVPASRVSKR